MTDEERKMVFWLLKKRSSYTAWKALAEAWQDFIENWGFALQHANFSDPSIKKGHTDSYKFFLDGEIALIKGLSQLRSGNKNVFSATSAGYFSQIFAPTSYAKRVTDPEEYVFDWAINKEEIFTTIERVMHLRNDVTGVFENPAPMAAASFRSSDALTAIDCDVFPSELQEVPRPTDITIFTSNEVPYDGVWEPEWRTLLEVSRSSEGLPVGIEKGCMNYLIAGSKAPYYHDASDQTPLIVTWRLIWEDMRYRDGSIPEEENAYLLTSSNKPNE